MSKISPKEHPIGVATMSSELPGAKNYFRWISSVFSPYLGRQILDIGSGYGIHLEYILPTHPHVTAIDLSAESVEKLRQKFRAYSDFEAQQADFEQLSDLEWLMTRGFDTITCFNVLEHLRDDKAALDSMRTILQRRCGVALLMVPAHSWLYGSMDREAGHFRRYNAASLGHLLKGSGFEILRLNYFNSFGLVPWFINNRVLKKELDGTGVGLQIRIFDQYIVPVISRLEAMVTFPFGQSLIAVAKVKL